jgi:hypothetical protein
MDLLLRYGVLQQEIDLMDKAEASKRIAVLLKDKIYVQPYKCDVCNAWHELHHAISYPVFIQRKRALEKKAKESVM